MNTLLQFDFIVDREKNTITVRREFRAGRPLVWDAYTRSELLDRWFAPRPMTTKTKSMEFRNGGHWHYAMVDTEGKEYWGRTDYIEIRPVDYYTALDGFCDETGELNLELPRAHWEVTFSDLGDNTLVQTVVTYNSPEDIEMVVNMGMQEGLMSTLERLDELLLKIA